MELEEYQKLAARTDGPLNKKYDHIHSLHMTMGITTELGKLTDIFKKNLTYGKEIDWNNVGEEIGDIMWYLVNFCGHNNINLNYEFEKNIKKLIAKFPDNFKKENFNNE